MYSRDVICIGASAGGVEALIQLVHELPRNLPAALFVVVHFPVESISVLPQILTRSGNLPARHPENGEEVQPGCIYVAPPNYHMLLADGNISLVRGPRENGFRPAVDPLFRSAARAFGPRVVGVILSGTMGDGTAGLQWIKRLGGIAMVQDPEEAVFSAMPIYAIEHVEVDQILPVKEIARKIRQLAQQKVEEQVKMTGEMVMPDANRDEKMVASDVSKYKEGGSPHTDSILTCPECGGTLWELQDGELVQYRCHVGHAYSSESILAEQAHSLEAALWTAVRALEERAGLIRRMAARAQLHGSNYSERRFLENAREAEHNADLIRRLILNGRTIEPQNAPPEEGGPPPDKHVRGGIHPPASSS